MSLLSLSLSVPKGPGAFSILKRPRPYIYIGSTKSIISSTFVEAQHKNDDDEACEVEREREKKGHHHHHQRFDATRIYIYTHLPLSKIHKVSSNDTHHTRTIESREKAPRDHIGEYNLANVPLGQLLLDDRSTSTPPLQHTIGTLSPVWLVYVILLFRIVTFKKLPRRFSINARKDAYTCTPHRRLYKIFTRFFIYCQTFFFLQYLVFFFNFILYAHTQILRATCIPIWRAEYCRSSQFK